MARGLDDGITVGAVNIFESIADRRIEAGRKAGLFDNLAGNGKPIPDLGTERKPGWWAARVVKEERSKMAAEDLDRHLAEAMPGLWRLATEDDVRARVAELNRKVDDYNTVTTWEPRRPLNVDQTVEKWRALKR